MDGWSFFIFAFTSFFTIINPFSAATMFVSLSKGDTKAKRLAMSRRASLAAAIVLLLFAFGGNFILNFFGVSVDAFRIAGGLLIVRVGLNMLGNRERHIRGEAAKEEAMAKDDVSIVPMAIPMLSGPGAMTTAIVLMQQAQGSTQVLFLVAAIVLMAVLSYLLLSRAHVISDFLGKNGKNVVERILGLLVLVVGVQFFINGVHGVLMLWGLIGA